MFIPPWSKSSLAAKILCLYKCLISYYIPKFSFS